MKKLSLLMMCALGATFTAMGTGFGGGIVREGRLFIGDNSMAGEVWLLRNKLNPEMNAEEGSCIRAVRRVYAEKSGIQFDQAPEPKIIFDIGNGKTQGNKEAALEAFRRLGEVAGDAMGNALTLIDGLAVIGGGVSGAWCPGCGDFSVLALYFKLLEKRQLAHEKITTVSGIGCSSRFPYFLQANGVHYIHARSKLLFGFKNAPRLLSKTSGELESGNVNRPLVFT